MQPLMWYVHRLKRMSFSEISWRCRVGLRDLVDRPRFTFGLTPALPKAFAGRSLSELTRGFSVPRPVIGSWNETGDLTDSQRKWCGRLRHDADQAAEHKATFFDLDGVALGENIDWHRDYGNGISAECVVAKSINYRDFETVGDCKYTWELNRHHQFVVLARACCAFGDAQYASAIESDIRSWITANRPGFGMNWRSPLELAIRLINWVWALDLIRDHGVSASMDWQSVLHTYYLHCWEIERNVSQGSSANNHLIGEAAALYIASSYLPDMPNASQWRDRSRAILEEEILRQTLADGCTREHALGYQLFVLQFLTVCALVGKWTNDEFSPEYLRRLESMYDFVAVVARGGVPMPMFGDKDDGYVLDLGNSDGNVRSTLAVAATLFDRSDWAILAGNEYEPVLWLFGQPGLDEFCELADRAVPCTIQNVGLGDSGYYLLQGEHSNGLRASVVIDCAELGYGSIAAHGHADALSFTLRVDGIPVFVDPGTYDYFTYPGWRDYFRSTKAHNTIVVDGKNQSEMLGPFMWGRRARSRCLEWNPAAGSLICEHDGYMGLDDPVMHQRRFEFDPSQMRVEIEDILIASESHELQVMFHIDSRWNVATSGNAGFILSSGKHQVFLQVDSELETELVCASEEGYLGWVSDAYHRRQPGSTIVAKTRTTGNASFGHSIIIELHE